MVPHAIPLKEVSLSKLEVWDAFSLFLFQSLHGWSLRKKVPAKGSFHFIKQLYDLISPHTTVCLSYWEIVKQFPEKFRTHVFWAGSIGHFVQLRWKYLHSRQMVRVEADYDVVDCEDHRSRWYGKFKH